MEMRCAAGLCPKTWISGDGRGQVAMDKGCCPREAVGVDVVHCTLHVVRCTLRFTLHVVRCTLYAVGCTLHVVRCVVYVVRCTLYVVRCTLYVARCTKEAMPVLARLAWLLLLRCGVLKEDVNPPKGCAVLRRPRRGREPTTGLRCAAVSSTKTREDELRCGAVSYDLNTLRWTGDAASVKLLA